MIRNFEMPLVHRLALAIVASLLLACLCTGCGGRAAPSREDVEDALNRWSANMNTALGRPLVHFEVGPETCTEHEDRDYVCTLEIIDGSDEVLPDLHHLRLRLDDGQWVVAAV